MVDHFAKAHIFLKKKDPCTPIFIVTLVTIARTWKQPECPWTDEWIKKIRYVYIMDYYSAIKRMKAC